MAEYSAMTHDIALLHIRRTLGYAVLVGAVALLPGAVLATPAQSAREQARYNVNARQLQQLLTRIRTDANNLRSAVEQTTPRGRAVGNARAAENDDVLYAIDDVLQEANQLSDQVSRTPVGRDDVDDFLRHAADLDRIMSAGQFRPAASSAWTRLRASVGDLASAYGIQDDWRDPQFASGRGYGGAQRLAGTYRLSATDSDNPDAVADRVLRGVSGSERTRISRQLRNRLTPPEIIAIDRDNGHVSIASSIGPQMTFDADGRARTETGPGGRTVTTRATVRAGELEVSTSGSGNSDFSVTFEPLDNGRSLRVTRRLYNDALREPIVVRSLYRRTSDTADWNVYSSRSGRGAAGNNTASRGMTVPSGTMFVATLDETLNVGDARDGDYISMRVQDGPSEFRNATIEGYVTSEPTRASTRTGLSLAFERIKLADGRVADFSGTIEGVRDPNGRDIAFDRAEANRDNGERSDQAIQRGAIGAAVGAILGAVVGGAKGAGIGAVIGAGGGAGTVLLDAQSQRSLPRGTRFTIRSDTFDMR
jgi:hypothetical protein